tara:strand:- start:6829 stop:9618 length:2790 start_codon:yes stop_codon:yes gene_type:complete
MKIVAQIVLISVLFLSSCESKKEESSLFHKFQNPTADARPMVRWWWNGNAIEADEIKRELAVMKEAGIGGVEINSIAMPAQAVKTDIPPLQWAGEEWCNMVKVASAEARELGLITDLIVGSGWPFGGKFLKEDETTQRLGIKKEHVKANRTIEIDLDNYLVFKSKHSPGSSITKENSDVALQSIKLIPVAMNSLNQIIDITSEVKNNTLVYKTGNRDYMLVFVYNERNFKSVYHGSPGADGPIMDHYNVDAVMGYLNRLKVLEKETGLALSELVRVLFCDSIELGGSNWTDDMAAQFLARNGYDITPYLPLVIQPHNVPNRYDTSDEMAETIKRVQYDFYNTIIKVFLERFTMQFQKFCTDNGVLCRYQAYGTPYYMGLFQGNMIPDIPESNNWIYSKGRDEAETSEFTWLEDHGYMLWNKAASSGAHITGKSITSCEAMTNLGGVFKTSLETIKQVDDLNFITGMNHAVLHGYNYSPPEAGFPGWIRYGSYFSEQNTWWNYFKNWTDYNSKLSSVFQNSKPTAQIAVLGRLRDYWGEESPAREVFNEKPWYYSRLWQPISNLGSSCDYIHQPVLETAIIKGKKLICGKMSYDALLLTEVESLTPQAALKLKAYAKAGGKVIIIGEAPYRSLSYSNAEKNDIIVKQAIESIVDYAGVIQTAAPKKSVDLLVWTNEIIKKIDLEPQVKISKPASHLYFMKQQLNDQELYFFVNSDRKKEVEVEVAFKTGNKVPYIWIPETGKRFALPYNDNNKLHLKLDALESALIVYESVDLKLPKYESKQIADKHTELTAVWDVKFEHTNGTIFTEKMKKLIDFNLSDDEAIKSFAGTVTYSTTFHNSGNLKFIKLKEVNQAVTELVLNGKPAGLKWYGNHCYDVSAFAKQGANKIEIKLTNTLANYCSSLKENPTAQEWTKDYNRISSGLVGVELRE